MFDEGIGLTELNYFIHMPCHSYRTKHDIFFSSYIKKILFQFERKKKKKKIFERDTCYSNYLRIDFISKGSK